MQKVKMLLSMLAMIGATLPPSSSFADNLSDPTQCQLSAQQRLINRQLPFAEFDLNPDRLKSPMWFSARRCYASAVAASRDYLATGPLLSVREHAIVTFHISRNLARLGDNAGASRLAAASRRSDQAPNATLDWNTYVTGFYGYLVGDLRLVQTAYDKLMLAGGEANLMNANVLRRTLNCPTKPFAEVEVSSDCGTP